MAAIGVGLASSVIPYICDQWAMAQLPRATFALFLAVLPAVAVMMGIVILQQLPSRTELLGVAFVIVGIALHRPTPQT
jgi:inner membrane transporter RhtA